MIAEGTIISDRYEIIEKIGEGGMAIVYRAEDITLKRDVTLKTLKSEFISDDDFKKRFTVEARAAAGLSHPNIVTVYDVGNDGDIYYIVMEYVDGYTLKELINDRAPFENKEAIGIAINIAAALAAAHSRGVVHRDIKPHNILIAKDGAIKVTDFGIARATSSTIVVADGLGSVHYFSPEQARGGYVDEKTDIYSLGIVLYEMVTGKLPFDGDNAVQLAMKHINDPLPDMLEFNPKITKSVEYIIKKSTAKSPSSRYQTAKEMSDDLKRAMNNDTGDFVKFNVEVTTSKTIRLTDEQLQEINKKANIPNDSQDGDYVGFVFGDNDGAMGQAAASNENIDEDSVGFTILPDEEEDIYSEHQEDTVGKKVTMAAIGVGALICILIGSIVFMLINRNTELERKVVPNLTGATLENAVKIANTNALYIEKSDDTSLEAADYDDGTVYKQEPAAGEEAKVGDTITVYVGTKKRQEVTMPMFVKRYLSEAQEEAEKIGIKIEVGEGDYEMSSKYDNDCIYKQEPMPGEITYVGSTVTVYLGTGEDVQEERVSANSGTSAGGKVIMSKVVGKTAEEARAIIEDLGLSVNIVEAYSSSYPKGVIIKQGYEGGESVEKGKTVTLVSSLGPEPVKPAAEPQKVIINAVGTGNTEPEEDKKAEEEGAAGAVIGESEENNAAADNSGNVNTNTSTTASTNTEANTSQNSAEDTAPTAEAPQQTDVQPSGGEVIDAGGDIAAPTMEE